MSIRFSLMNKEERENEILKMLINPLEFFAYCKINDPSLHRVVDFEFWPHCISLIKALIWERLIIILKAKQMGVSHIFAFWSLYNALFKNGDRTLLLSAGEDASALLLEKAVFANDRLPGWMKLPYGKKTATEISFPDRNFSKIVALASTEIPGIGYTSSRAILDEWDFHRFPEASYATAEPTAANKGQLAGGSTVDKSKPESLFKVMYKQAVNGESDFKPLFIGCLDRPDRDEEWYELERRKYIGREDYLEENYPKSEEEALSPVSAKAFFDTKILQEMIDNSREPTESDGVFHSYTNFMPAVGYGAGADVSQGIGGDYQALTLFGKKGLSVEDVAYIHANDLMPETYAYITNEQIGKKYNFPLLAGENNSMGLSYLQSLLELGYRRLYYQDEKRIRLGWNTNEKSRETMLYDLSQGIANRTINIRYKPLLLELLEVQRIKIKGDKGDRVRIQSVGKHDDLVMSAAIAYQMVKNVHPIMGKSKPLLKRRVTAGMYR